MLVIVLIILKVISALCRKSLKVHVLLDSAAKYAEVRSKWSVCSI